MSGCKTTCPNCLHEFTCCQPAVSVPRCCQAVSTCAAAQMVVPRCCCQRLESHCCKPTVSHCCQPTVSTCCTSRRAVNVLSGGGVVSKPSESVSPQVPPTNTTYGRGIVSQLAPPPHFCPLMQASSMNGANGGGIVSKLAAPVSPCSSPQIISPSVPLSFIMPPFVTPVLDRPLVDAMPETELERLSNIERDLHLSGWYYEGLSFQESNELLKDTKVGTFLVRNSADPNYLYSLSVRTKHGPTSVRLFYTNGYFRLDAEPYLIPSLPLFASVVELVQFYVRQTKQCQVTSQVWVDPDNWGWFSAIVLRQPLLKKKQPPKLMHLARVAIHGALEKAFNHPSKHIMPRPHTQLELPASLITYLNEYPYSI